MAYKVKGDLDVGRRVTANKFYPNNAGVTHATGVAVVPDHGNYDLTVVGVSNASTGDVVIDPPTGTLTEYNAVEVMILSTDVIARNVVFDTIYKGVNGIADLGTVSIPAVSATTGTRNFTFRRATLSDSWVLTSDTDGIDAGGGLTKAGTITADPAPASEGIYTLDASGGAFDFTLPAATGSQARVMVIGGDVTTNAVTVKVQSGETMATATDGTYTVSVNQEATLFVDVGLGAWSVQVVGEGTLLEGRSVALTAADFVHSGAGTFAGGAGNPSTGQILLLDGTASLSRLGDKGLVTFELEFDQDTAFTLDLVNVIPAGGKILSYTQNVYAAGGEHIAMIRGANDTSVSFNRNDAINADVKVAVMIVADGWTVFEDHILAGMVVPTPLARFSFGSAIAASTFVGPTGDFQLPFTITNYTAYNPQGIANLGTGEITAPADGDYDVTLSCSAEGSGSSWYEHSLWLEVDGVTVVRTKERSGHAAGNWGQAQPALATVVPLTAGQVLTFHSQFTTGTAPTSHEALVISVQQLASSSVVDPGALVPTDLHYDYRSLAGATTDSFINLGAGNNGNDWTSVEAAGQRLNLAQTGGLLDASTNGVTVNADEYVIVNDGRYEFKLDAQAGADTTNSTGWFQLVKNGFDILAVTATHTISNATQTGMAMHWVGDLTAADTIDIRFGSDVNANALFGHISYSLVQQTALNVLASYPNTLEATALASGRADLAADQGLGGAYGDVTGVEVTLPAAGRYRVFGQASTYTDGSTAAGGIQSRLFDVTAAAAVDGSVTTTYGGSNSTYNAGAANYYEVEMAVTEPTVVRLQAQLFGGGTTFTIRAEDTFLAYQQLPAYEVVTPGDVPVIDNETVFNSGISVTDAAGAVAFTLGGGVTWNDVISDYEYISLDVESNVSATSHKWHVNRIATSEVLEMAISGTRQVIVTIGGDLNTGDYTINPSSINVTDGELRGIRAQKTVVTPDEVIPTTVTRAKLTQSAAQSIASGAPVAIEYDGVAFDNDGSVASTANNRLEIQTSGWYEITAQVAQDAGTNQSRYITSILVNAAVVAAQEYAGTNQQDGSTQNASTGPLQLTAGDLVTVTFEQSTGNPRTLTDGAIGNWLAITQLADSTVTRPEDIVVDDQAAAGYVDIGNVRMQWGNQTLVANNGDVVFPAPFADTSYAWTATVEAAFGDRIYVVQSSAKTTTQIHYDKVFHDNAESDAPAAAPGEPFSWIAIGVKP